jgi:hypothetical protein
MPLSTKIHAKKKCHERAIDSHFMPGIVIHPGNAARTQLPLAARVAPSTPVVSNSRPRTSA